MNTRWLALAAVGLASTAVSAATPSHDEVQIRAARASANAGLAARDLERAAMPIASSATLILSTGEVVDLPRMRAIFAASFDDPELIAYVRTPTRVRVAGTTAAEHGRWEGRFKHRRVTGTYLARWNNLGGTWRIVGEMFIAFGCSGSVC